MFIQRERAKAILELLNKLTQKFDGDAGKAAAQLDKDLGDMWREELKKADMDSQIPDSSNEDSAIDESEEFYTKLRGLLDGEDLPPQLVDDDACGDEKKHRAKEDKKANSIVHNIKMFVMK